MVYELEFLLSYVGTEATQKGRIDSESAYFPRISSIPSTAMGDGDGDGAPTPPVTTIAVSAAAGMAAPPASVDDANVILEATAASAAGAAMARLTWMIGPLSLLTTHTPPAALRVPMPIRRSIWLVV